MPDTDERARFDAWWTGEYGWHSMRAEWADTPTDAAWMAWQAQAAEIKRLRVENIQMRFALGHPMPADLERYILPSNPFKCGTCGARAALAQGGDK